MTYFRHKYVRHRITHSVWRVHGYACGEFLIWEMPASKKSRTRTVGEFWFWLFYEGV